MNSSPSVTDYLRPPLNEIPNDILCVNDYERLAPQFLSPGAFAYISGGSGCEQTLRANRSSFDDFFLQQRVLVDCSQGSTATSWLGQPYRHPIMLAPVAFQRLAHVEGELATARAADALQACMVASTLSSNTLEAIASELNGSKWFQLYFQPYKEHTLDLIQRAEAAGYHALVVTLDAPIQAMSYRAKRAQFSMPQNAQPMNLVNYAKPQQQTLPADQSVIFQGMMSEAPNWSDLEWLLKQTTLPVIIKGVTHPLDAQRLVQMGVQGIIVSNHGGRTLDGLPSTLDCLHRVRQVLGSQVPLFIDGGIRSGSDVFKAIALGASAVLVGRPQMYALAVAGALGVAHMLKVLRDELECCMALAGCPSIGAITEDCLHY